MKGERLCWLAALAFGAMLLLPGTQARAQPAGSTAAPPLTPVQQAEWDKRRAEGKAAAHFSQWAKALEAYQVAWAIKRDWQLAANLGRAELTLHKYRDAAEHLSYVLREAPPSLATEAPAEWNDLRQMLRKARAKVGALIIIVEQPGAEVLVNGLIVGEAPLSALVFVDPGEVTVEARAKGFALGSVLIKAVAGREQGVSLALVPAREKAEVEARVPPKRAPGRVPAPAAAPKRLDEITVVGITLTSVAAAAGIGFGAAIPFHKSREGDVITPQNLCFWSFVGAGLAGSATAIYALARKTEPVAVSVGYHGTSLTVTGRW